jgi:hypothetical protein
MRGGGVSRYIGPETGESRRAHESLNGPIVVANDVLFWFFHMFFYFFLVFSTQILNFEKSFILSPGPKSSLVPACKIFLRCSDDQKDNTICVGHPSTQKTQITYIRHKTVYRYYEKKTQKSGRNWITTSFSSLSQCY